MSLPPRPRVALIGISGYGSIHLQLAREWRDRGALDLTACAVINAEEEKDNIAELRAKGTEIFADFASMLAGHAGRLDLCLIPTGIPWHARMTIAALAAGANVLVEKPLAGSTAEIAEIREMERHSGRFVAVGFQDLYDPTTLWLQNELRRGMIGEIRQVRFLGQWPRARAYFTRNNWAGRLLADGVPVLDSPLNNAFAHFVMLSLFFAGMLPEDEDDAAIEEAELWRAHAIESFDTAVVTMRSRRKVGFWFGASHSCREVIEPEIVVEGTLGRACWRYEREVLLQLDGQADTRHEIPDTNVIRRAMMAAVMKRLSDPTAPICGTAMASRHTAVIEAVHRAAPILNFPESHVQWLGPNGKGSEIPFVEGLEAALRRAYFSQTSLRQSGFDVTGRSN